MHNHLACKYKGARMLLKQKCILMIAFLIGIIIVAGTVPIESVSNPASQNSSHDTTAVADRMRNPSAKQDPLSVMDVINLESAANFEISPSGKWVLWTKETSDQNKNERVRQLFLTSLEDTLCKQLTRGASIVGAPHFSPDGSRIAFLRKPEKGAKQIYILDLHGGEAEKITSVQIGVRDFAWESADAIVFTAREDSTVRERTLKKDKDDVVVVADQEHYSPVRLFRFDVKNKKTKRLTTHPGQITEFRVSPDGRWVVTNESQSVDYAYDRRIPPKQYLLDLQSLQRREIFTAPHINPYEFRWGSDSNGFYCRQRVASDSTNNYVGITRLYYYDLVSDSLDEVLLDWDSGLGGPYAVIEDGLVVSLADGVRSRLTHLRTNGGMDEKMIVSSPSGLEMRLLCAEREGRRIIYLASNASTIPEIRTAICSRGDLTGDRLLLKLNESARKKSLARTEVMRWAGALGDTVEGILYYPLAYQRGQTYPLVALIHGGPSGVDPDFFTERWTNYPNLLSSKGVFVLKVNYHGSGNYGLEWVESIKNHYYEYEVPDIRNGIDTLIAEGLVSADKLGIMGWSNGAILAVECCLRDPRFKVLLAGAGDVNWTSDYGNCAFGAAFDNAYFGGAPWEIPETYMQKSPLFRMEEMTVPTLIMFGTKDRSVPTEQGWQHFRAMQQIGKAPVRFLLFPGASHGLSKISHRRRKMEEELAWIDRYLFETPQDKIEALDNHSPLAFELKKASVKRKGHLIGDTAGSRLIPETVEFEGIKIGRFEVTKAQFHAFDPNFTVAPGTDNHPVTGISLPLAQTYCMWLSEKTGRSFRLLTDAEMEKLLKASKDNLPFENTLDYWAGYRLTPDEGDEVIHKIIEMEKTQLLIEPVGSFRPVGEQGVYDLGGNVAEWVVADGREGRIMGFSAVTSFDERASYKRPPLDYVGFRVCEE
jgi:dipeptidyl aminopeptidase/acylaminoacyl peptidase